MNHFQGFKRGTFTFLNELSRNNRRDWFAENSERYQEHFLKPALAFIESMASPLEKAAPMLLAVPKKSGGSLMRIYKDTRFAKDKTPYKTNIGIQFRHRAGRDVHAPGLYVHIDCQQCFVGAGLWRPNADALRSIRENIADNSDAWMRIIGPRGVGKHLQMYEDDRLKSMPRGFSADHPAAEQLKKKSFLGMANVSRKQVQDPQFTKDVVQLARRARPLMEFLCAAVDQPY